ncbi:MAG: TonB family protein [Alphaproteobacteria bacterium]
MTRLRQQHWMLAFILALAIHLTAYMFSISLPGGAPVYRGGTFDQSGKPSPSAGGVFVQLGNSGESSGEINNTAALRERAPALKTREALAQGFVAGDGKPGSGAEKSESPKPPEAPKPVGKPVPQRIAIPPADEVGPAPRKIKEAKKTETEIVAAPVPRRRPKRPSLLPEMETLGRRLSVQGPTKTAQSKAQAKSPRPKSTRQGAKTGAGKPKGENQTTSGFAFVSGGGRVGTASGNRTGEIRELNYEDQVLLWIKRHGGYPYEAAMFRLEDTVTLKFAITRQGDILYYHLIKKSEYHLLNKAIEWMMDRSSPVPPIPPEIAKNELIFTVPVHFDPRRLP